MKRLIISLALGLALVVGVRAMMDATQNRPDDPAPGSSSTLEFDVSTRDFQRGEAAAAAALWAVCAATVDGTVSAAPEPVGAAWRVTISPALGEHGRKRLVGCFDDVTIDRAKGNVVSLESVG